MWSRRHDGMTPLLEVSTASSDFFGPKHGHMRAQFGPGFERQVAETKLVLSMELK